MMKTLSAAIEALLGVFLNRSLVRKWVLPPETCYSHQISDGLKGLADRSDPSDRGDKTESIETESPVFIFSAGWGSGSTLLQRLILSSNEVMIWGESFDEAAPIQRLALTVSPFRAEWPPDYHFKQATDAQDLSNTWVANLSPPVSAYRKAHAEFIRSWLGDQSGTGNQNRWGLKEVRLNIHHARYLKWLYPEAKFVFIYRDLHSCYKSCRKLDWLSVWPNYGATNILAFSHHWKYLLEGFIAGHKDVGGLLFSYEDLIKKEECIEEIRDYLSVSHIDKGILLEKLGSIGGGSRSEGRRELRFYEKIVLNSVAGKLRKKLGY